MFFFKDKNKNHKITISQAKKLLKDKEIIVVDVRTPEEFVHQHLPNAINLNIFDKNFQEKVSALEKDSTYLLYCKSGQRCNSTLYFMLNCGFKNVYSVQGDPIKG